MIQNFKFPSKLNLNVCPKKTFSLKSIIEKPYPPCLIPNQCNSSIKFVSFSSTPKYSKFAVNNGYFWKSNQSIFRTSLLCSKKEYSSFQKKGLTSQTFLSYLEKSWLIDIGKSTLISIHEYFGLPWWEVFIGLSVFIHLLDLPLQRLVVKNQKKLMTVELRTLRDLLTKIKDKNELKKIQESIRFYQKEVGYSSLLNFVPLLCNIPISIYFGFVIRFLCLSEPSMVVGGFSWFLDFTSTDPYWRLPVLLFLFQIFVFQANPLWSSPHLNKFLSILKFFFPWFLLGSLFIFMILPQGIVYFWLMRILLTIPKIMWVKYGKWRKLQESQMPKTIIDSPFTYIFDRNYRFRKLIRANSKLKDK